MGSLDGKYGNGRTHDPRCNCPDCNAAFAQHNTGVLCKCYDCTCHREITGSAPRVTRPEEIQYTRWVTDTGKPPFPTGVVLVETREKSMGNLNVCERPGCNAIIKGDAAGRVEVEANIGPDGERKLYVLCPPCVGDVDSLLHARPTADRERAYDKPYEGYKPIGDQDDVKAASVEQLLAELIQREMRKQRELESGSTDK